MAEALFEFVIVGVPRSQQSRKSASRERWKRRVLDAALRQWSLESPALDGRLSASIVYFHVDDTEIDVDNVIKPILDALKTYTPTTGASSR